jgi:hypothetical protein
LVAIKLLVGFIRGYKVIFMTFARKNSGFWLRYTELFKDNGYSGLWFASFGERIPEGFLIKHDIRNAYVSRDYAKINGSIFSLKNGEASAVTNKFKWFLKIKPLFKTVNSMPFLFRVFRRGSEYVMVTPLAIFNGSITYDDRVYEISEYKGMIGYISSNRYLHHWVWVHCSGFEEDNNGWLDLLIASPDGTKDVMFGSIMLHGKMFYIGRMIGLPFNGKYDIDYLRTNVRINRNVLVNINVIANKNDMIIAKYEDPVEGYRYCHNTEIADMSMTMQINNETKQLTCVKRTFFEYALPRILDENLSQIKYL